MDHGREFDNEVQFRAYCDAQGITYNFSAPRTPQSNGEDEFFKTLSNSTDDEDETNKESKVENKAEGNEDEGMDCTTNQLDDDVDVRLNEPVNTDEAFIQKE
nr:retrovirus-related Pol polyprotein from transposon TNT 1-94 [Tanacetum cinerariifolium]